MIINIVKRFYGDISAYTPAAPTKRPSPKRAVTPQRSTPITYAEHYSRVKEVAKDKNWSDYKVNEMLNDKVAFEKEWKMYKRAH